MSYRDDLIRQIQQDGYWNQLSGEDQKRFEALSDDQARQMMVMGDHWDLGEPEAIGLFGVLSLVEMIMSFKGALVGPQGDSVGRLSPAGRSLAEFFLALDEKGLSSDDVDAGLKEMNPLVIAALKTVYKRTKE